MKFKSSLIELGQLDEEVFQKIKTEVLQATSQEWLTDTKRQNYWNAHKKTESIVLKMGREYETSQFTCAWEEKWQYILRPLMDKLESIYGSGEVTRMIISKLFPSSEVGEHMDTERLLHFSHRIHLPIETNEEVAFSVRGQKYKLEEAMLYELSNQDLHSVENTSTKDRIHIIVDYADRNCIEILKGEK